MEHKIRAAVTLAVELSHTVHHDMQPAVFHAVFNAMMAGTLANPLDCGHSSQSSDLSDNLGKWLSAIVDAINQGRLDQAKVDAIGSDVKNVTEQLETAVENATK